MRYYEWKARMNGNAFDDADVARCYAHRPPYAPELYEFLLALVPHKNQLVDLGCGPGKVAADLAPHFGRVLAIDPAAAMVAEARRLHATGNITWLHAQAEDAALPARIDLVTAGSAIHWMQHDVLFPRLAECSDLVAVLYINAPPDPRWAPKYDALMTRWLARIDQTYDPSSLQAKNRRYEPWLDIAGDRAFTVSFSQSVADFLAALHSSATFSRSRMGTELAAELDRDFEAMLAPHAKDGLLRLETTSELTWGAPRRTPRA